MATHFTRFGRVAPFSLLALLALVLFAGPARALTVDVTHAGPSLVGQAHTFTANVTDATGEVTFEWRFGDEGDFMPGGAEMSHVFEAPGLYSIDVAAVDASGSTGGYYTRHLVHHPLTEARPTSSTSIVYDPERNRVYSVNQDNDTLTVIDPDALTAIAELSVYRRPVALMLAPGGKLWVVHQDDYAVAVVDLDSLVVERGFRLPYASQPVGVASSPRGDAAYVSLMATGKLLKLDPNTGEVLGEVDVGPRPRGVAITHDGAKAYVTRFTSPNEGGEVIKVDTATLTVEKRILLPLDSETVDSDQQARGLPNYLFAVALTPDGRQAWIPGKKDNIGRGPLIDGQDLTHDTLVRPLTSIIDTQSAEEIYDQRIDLDDRSPPVHVEFTPYGNFAILSLAGSNRIEVRDVTNPTQVFSAIANVGAFPVASVLLPQGLLFVQAALSRNVLVYDMTALLETFDTATPSLVAEIAAVGSEKLGPEVLAGKKLFNNAEDTRMAFEGYISCGACHFEGLDDGRVFDFSSRGEGLRNTLSLIGTGQGRLNWTGTFDEVQDFEHQIRDLFDGTGFITDDVLATGTYGEPLGDSKKGLSPELDALDAYVASLDQVNPSPFRNPDGTLTADAVVGKALFEKIGCDFCHSGPGFSDSERGRLHDVGTATQNSGTRLGEPLRGFDTPTLLGVWETPPYLHDGSAATLRDVLTTRNPEDRHGLVSVLSDPQIDQLVAYLLQIDGELGVRTLPFETPQPVPAPPPAAVVEVVPAFGLPTGVAPAQLPSPGLGTPTTGAPPAMPEPSASPASGPEAPGCSSSAATGRERPSLALLLGLLGTLWTWRRRRAYRWFALASVVGCAPWVHGCGEQAGVSGDAPHASAGPTPSDPTAVPTNGDWSALPPVVDADHELAALGSREATFNRICARGHNDTFARALCSGGEPPAVKSLVELLALAGLGEDERAFALTGNSTSVVAKHVSAINPRLIVFPRVGTDLQRPDTMTAVGFVRGEQFVEVVSRDSVTDDYNFYLFAFEQACNYEDTGCDLASLLSEEIEHGWTAYSVYDHVDLEPTSLDCLSCHRMGPPGTKRILRMQELTGPWLHWFPQRFGQRTDSDRVLTAQFADAHRVDSQYGGIPMATLVNAIDEGSAAQLEALVRAEGSEQPNPFDGHIVQEVAEGASPTWEARFKAHLRGEAIAVPYPLMDVTDEAKRTAAVESYLNVVTGVAPRDSLIDLRDVFTDDAKQKLSFVSAPGADGETVLLQMCARCHDGRGDPTLPKNRFNVLQLETVPAAVKALAIARMNAEDHTRMPPRRVGDLSAEAISAATSELQK
jgi:MYXO-CTERM domain-containing protein